MTTAARPTFQAAMGGYRASDSNFATQVISAKALPGHTKLKLRQPGQNTEDDIAQRDFKLELQKAENEYKLRKRKGKGFEEPLKLLDEEDLEEVKLLKKPKLIEEAEANLDADDSSSSESDESDSDDSSSDEDDDEDETALLLKELEKIKKERTEEKERIEREKAELEEEQKAKEIAQGNPLLNVNTSAGVTDFSVKRRWDDDVVFKNQARLDEKPQKRFVNDTLRSDFHRKFISKYIQ
ncbi:Pre-mRNA-splicing factor Cwf15/Cwc15 [Paraphysoderma sedebokerense]|nr:Pre-mRNA-splicing factor Cwf15/Cwc15 [Paraphysoderma sedebokerense]